MKRPRWACFKAALIAFLALLLASAAIAQDSVIRFASADFVLSDSTNPPADSAAWQPVTLPDLWARSRPGVLGVGWYRLSWRIDGPLPQVPALYLPDFGPRDHAWVNGTQLNRSALPSVAGPRLFDVDPVWLRRGDNTLYLRMQFRVDVPVAMQAGEAADLRSAYERRKWLAVTGPHQLAGAAAALGLFMLLLWTKRRAETAYGYFGLASSSYAVWLANMLGTLPIPPLAWAIVNSLAGQLVNVATLVFAFRYAGWRRPRLEALLWLSVPFGLAVSLIQTHVQLLWFVTSPVFIGYVAVFGWTAWRRRTGESIALLLASPGCAISFALYESGLGFGPVDLPVALDAYSDAPLFLVIGWLLVQRFVRSLNDSEQLNAELEQRVEQKHVELQRNYTRMQQVERQAAITEERARIMSDMHDGIGGQLISTLSLVEHGRVTPVETAAALRECIDDLRLSIDSLQPADADLLPVLGNLRYRLEPRLAAQGIVLDWQVADVPKLACLTPQNILHILRILQEAFTNVLKHARADRIVVETGTEPGAGRIYIRVSDNGCGFTGERAAGRGLANMLRRAKAVGGELQVRPSPAGTTLELQLPLA